jgi:hypothetical protein
VKTKTTNYSSRSRYALNDADETFNTSSWHIWFKVGASHLNGVLLHGQRPVDSVQFEVEAARIAHRFTLIVTSPQRRGGGAAVGTSQSRTPRRRLSQPN